MPCDSGVSRPDVGDRERQRQPVRQAVADVCDEAVRVDLAEILLFAVCSQMILNEEVLKEDRYRTFAP